MKDRLISGELLGRKVEEEEGRGGVPPLNRSFIVTASVLRYTDTSMLQNDKTRHCRHAKCISILNTSLCILQHWYHLADVQVSEEFK